MCTMPLGTFFFSFLRKTFFFPPALAITFQSNNQKLLLARRLLLGDGGASWSLARTRVRMSALTTHRQRTAMTQTAIAADVHQPLDVHLHAFAQVALDLALRF